MKKANITIRQKLFAGFFIALIITMIVGGRGVYISSNTLREIQDIQNNDLELLLSAERLKHAALTHRRYEKDFFLNIGKLTKQKGYLEKFDKVSALTQDLLASVAAGVSSEPDFSDDLQTGFQNTVTAYENYYSGFKSLSSQVLTEVDLTPQQANKLMKPIKQEIYNFEKGIDLLVKEAEEIITKVTNELINATKRAKRDIGILLGVGLVICCGFGWAISRSITKPISQAVEYTTTMAKGDFTQNLEANNSDEVGQLVTGLNEMANQLRATLLDVVTSIETLTDSSTQLATISEDLTEEADNTSTRSDNVTSATEEMTSNLQAVAAASEQSATNVTMVASATEQMSATITEIATNTDKAQTISGEAVEYAATASNSMESLGRAANDITKVTETITEISEQTNLLALNATIEAARAGEAGKGFAVVANEIKELAKQTAEATMDIKAKIEDVQTTTDSSVGQIKVVSEVITGINEIINEMATAVNEQSSATREISTNINQASEGIHEVNENVNQSSEVSRTISEEVAKVNESTSRIEQGSATVKESSANLSQLAEQLKSMVASFEFSR